jgi:hypothetical protein
VSANQLAKLIVDMATGAAPADTTVDGKDPAAVALGRKGGLKGGGEGAGREIVSSAAQRNC